MSNLVKVKTPARAGGHPQQQGVDESPPLPARYNADGQPTGKGGGGQGGGKDALWGGGGGFGDVGALGDMIKNKVQEVLSGVAPLSSAAVASYRAQQQQQHQQQHDHEEDDTLMQGPTSLENMLRDRVHISNPDDKSQSVASSTLPDAASVDDDRLSLDSLNSQASRASNASSVQLQDGTDAMVIAHCMRRGHEALECHVCLQVFTKPVVPTAAACRCTFCHACFNDLVSFGGKCSKCHRALPRDVSQCEADTEVEEAILMFQRKGGEDAEYAAMMTSLRGGGKGGKAYRVMTMGELQIHPKPIALGAYGQVFKGVWNRSREAGEGVAVAIKKILKPQMMTREQTIESFRKEVDILSILDHPHVLKLYGAVLEDDNICIVTELVPGGSLFDLIYTKPQLRPEAVVVIGQGVCKGMTYLHTLGVIHRDLKPGNLLMGAVQGAQGPELVVKVADFGLARVQDTARTMTGGVGTSQYTAPEVLRSEWYDAKADVFSFGIILWEVHARKIPYGDMTQTQIAVAVATQNHRPPPPPNCPAALWELMQRCWDDNARVRPTFGGVLTMLEDMQMSFNLSPSMHSAQQQPQQPQHTTQGSFQKTFNHGDKEADVAQSHEGAGSAGVKATDGARQLRVPQEHKTIMAAIKQAERGDQIVIAPGHYREAIVVQGKNIELIGGGSMQHLLLECPAGEKVCKAVILVQGGMVRVRNLMIKGSEGGDGIRVHGGGMVVEDCNVSGAGKSAVRVEGGGGGSGEVMLRRSVLCRCGQNGMLAGAGGLAAAESCSFFENGAYGVIADGQGAKVKVTRCMVSYNKRAGVAANAGGEILVEDNDLRYNEEGTHDGQPPADQKGGGGAAAAREGKRCNGTVRLGVNLTE